MQERLKLLRANLGLTQEKFAERIGIKRNSVANYESGRNPPIDAVISLICREFNVNEQWLRTGEGEMFATGPESELDALLNGYTHLTPETRALIKTIVGLPESDQQAVKRFITRLMEEMGYKHKGNGTACNMSLSDLHDELDRHAAIEKGDDISKAY